MSNKVLVTAAICALALGACASDEAPEEPTDQVPVDTVVGDGVDTEIEESENLGFDESDEG